MDHAGRGVCVEATDRALEVATQGGGVLVALFGGPGRGLGGHAPQRTRDRVAKGAAHDHPEGVEVGGRAGLDLAGALFGGQEAQLVAALAARVGGEALRVEPARGLGQPEVADHDPV